MLLLKNPQFLPNDYEIKYSWVLFFLTEFHNHWVKIVDFLIKAFVLWSLNRAAQVCKCLSIKRGAVTKIHFPICLVITFIPLPWHVVHFSTLDPPFPLHFSQQISRVTANFRVFPLYKSSRPTANLWTLQKINFDLLNN